MYCRKMRQSVGLSLAEMNIIKWRSVSQRVSKPPSLLLRSEPGRIAIRAKVWISCSNYLARSIDQLAQPMLAWKLVSSNMLPKMSSQKPLRCKISNCIHARLITSIHPYVISSMNICCLGLRDLASDRQLDICPFNMYQPCHSGNLLSTQLAVVSIKLLASANYRI